MSTPPQTGPWVKYAKKVTPPAKKVVKKATPPAKKVTPPTKKKETVKAKPIVKKEQPKAKIVPKKAVKPAPPAPKPAVKKETPAKPTAKPITVNRPEPKVIPAKPIDDGMDQTDTLGSSIIKPSIGADLDFDAINEDDFKGYDDPFNLDDDDDDF